MTDQPKTNITPELIKAFDAITSGQYKNLALVSCFIDGEPGAAICSVTPESDDNFRITPLFVSITDKMVITKVKRLK